MGRYEQKNKMIEFQQLKTQKASYYCSVFPSENAKSYFFFIMIYILFAVHILRIDKHCQKHHYSLSLSIEFEI